MSFVNCLALCQAMMSSNFSILFIDSSQLWTLDIGLWTQFRLVRRFGHLQFTVQNITQFFLATTRAFGNHDLVLYIREYSADGLSVALLNEELRIFAVFGKELFELF